MDFDPQKPDLLFEFRYRSKAMLWALGIIPPLKREAPQIADVEDEDILPPPKRQKGEHDKGLTWSLQVRSSQRAKLVQLPNDGFN